MILETLDLLTDILSDGAAEEEAVGLHADLFQPLDRLFGGLAGGAVEEEQLADLVVKGHVFDGFLYPGDLLIVQIEGFRV